MQRMIPIFFTVLWSLTAIAHAAPPNVIVILTDDQGWGDLSFNGNQNLSTPHIDSLAKDGASFDRFYVCPVCSPTRAEFLTGRYHTRLGVYSTSAGGERINLDETTIAETFKKGGYVTAAFGKWHNGMQPPYHPNARGFDEYYGFCSGHWGNYFSPPLERNGKLVKGEGFVIDDFTNHAMQFIEQHKERPFFTYLAYNTPHSPMQVPERFWTKFKDKKLTMRHWDPAKENSLHLRAALAMCENIDWNVGRVLKKLDELKLSENTIIVYFCDNGPNGARWNGGMKGRKGSTDEGGVRSPLFIRWPKSIKPGTRIKQNGAAIDLLPTLADLAGIPIATQKPWDGVSLKPLLLGQTDRLPERLIFSHWRNRVSVRSETLMLDHQGKLFNLSLDPGQNNDLSRQMPKDAAILRFAVDEWKLKMKLGQIPDTRPFPIGHPNYTYTQLPIRDAKSTGMIKRSNRFPNDSYFTNWINTVDKITWNAEVLADGEFQVEVYYTCPAEDVGSTIEVRFNDQSLQGKVTKAHNPPVQGAENDRVKRQESYVKDFRPLNLGTIKLKKGKGEFTLRAIEKKGQEVMEVRLIMLTRVK